MTWAIKMADARYDGYDEGYEKGISVGLEQGLEQGRATGREEGAYQTKLETAKSFLAEGLTPQVVARCTGLPIERVMELSTTTDRLKEE